jgi:hypothetical protein
MIFSSPMQIGFRNFTLADTKKDFGPGRYLAAQCLPNCSVGQCIPESPYPIRTKDYPILISRYASIFDCLRKGVTGWSTRKLRGSAFANGRCNPILHGVP